MVAQSRTLSERKERTVTPNRTKLFQFRNGGVRFYRNLLLNKRQISALSNANKYGFGIETGSFTPTNILVWIWVLLRLNLRVGNHMLVVEFVWDCLDYIFFSRRFLVTTAVTINRIPENPLKK